MLDTISDPRREEADRTVKLESSDEDEVVSFTNQLDTHTQSQTLII
jgi:hypothetical protein